MSYHTDVMEAKGYWKQVIAPFYFEKPGDKIGGLILDLLFDGPPTDPTPVMIIQTREGDRYRVTASQERLKALLKAECPAKGDRILITHTDVADTAPKGKSKSKLFTVEVRRQIPPQTPPEPGS